MSSSKSIPEPANTSAVPKTDDLWRPCASLEILTLRATLLARMRSFFMQQGVLEIDTPLLSRFGSTDTFIESFLSSYTGPGGADGLPLYLHTSPEFFMKRLLAAGSGPIYQLAHVFRNAELGRRHNPEFMMLEWYRPGMDHQALMDETDALLSYVLEGFMDYQPAKRVPYRQWFRDGTGLDPWTDKVAAFRRFAERRLDSVPEAMDDQELDPWLDLLVTHWLEPGLGDQPVFVYDYPVSQASLARVRQGRFPVAERFELYIKTVELANGFHELADAAQQQQRFESENRVRERMGKPAVPIDRHLLAALQSGLPDCAGVAIGFDRLVMVAAGLPDIASAMPFPLSRV
ncbi:MAG: elongation factor P--(R)-beta-lysine ligase [Gammaproteobacteria bacterium]|nr:MAG: elongation factor P--(R)-beta-lysine ligase [Gammaproteobacteria bacterium]